MSVTVELPANALARLNAEADRRGVSIDVVIAELAHMLPEQQAAPPARRNLAFAGIGASGRGISDHVDEILADGFGRD